MYRTMLIDPFDQTEANFEHFIDIEVNIEMFYTVE